MNNQSDELNFEILSNSGDAPGPQPPNFRPTHQLFEYQRRSLGWMMSRENAGAGGGILADAIGFGKTTIALALIDHHRAELLQDDFYHGPLLRSRATLVIVPPNLVHQWGQEINKFFRSGLVKVVLAADVGQFKARSVQEIRDADVVIVSYRIFCGPKYNHRLNQKGVSRAPHVRFPVLEWFEFHRVIADEFHELIAAASNPNHLFNRAVHSLRALRSPNRWGLTSTPPLRQIRELVPQHLFSANRLQTIERVAQHSCRTWFVGTPRVSCDLRLSNTRCQCTRQDMSACCILRMRTTC